LLNKYIVGNCTYLVSLYRSQKFFKPYLRDEYYSNGWSSLAADDSEQRYINIPTFVFKDRDLAALEAVVVYLKDSLGYNYAQIAKLLNRDDRTIWTTYKRAKQKLKEVGK
jgi:hypothetical protein